MEEKNLAVVEVVDIQFRPGQKIYYFDPAGKNYKAGDHVIIDTARGPEYGTCTGGNHHIADKDVVSPLRPVLRIANAYDERIAAENLEKEKKAYEVCQEKIAEYGLDMQLVSAECSFDGSKILFFFTADERVDFRELVKNLASSFHTRIELRQIGVRDKAKMVGGLGICGRPFCCASFLDDFQPVSIKMAKTQNLSLNPVKISGTCGRLMCCLKYEQDAYEDLLKTMPKADSFVDTPHGRGTIVDMDLLRQRVKVRLENEPDNIVTCANEEIAVLRSGKAKKNDPPIPDDLAPISGNGKRAEKEEFTPVFLDPIKFIASAEEPEFKKEPEVKAAEEDAPSAPETEEKSKRSRRNRHHKNRPERKDAPAKEGPAKVSAPAKEGSAKASAPAKETGETKPAEQTEQPKKNRNRHRRYYRPHKPKQNNAE